MRKYSHCALAALAMVGPGCAIVAADDGPTVKNAKRLAEGPAVFPNSVKYRDDGAKPATGRAGSAEVTARALIDSNGKTALEITTGSLDTPADNVGQIKKTQIKVLDKYGESLATMNDWPADGNGRVDYTFKNLVRGQDLALLVNVSDIDPARTGVASLAVRVKRRPDLAVVKVVAPARVTTGTDVAISAQLTELNGDVGARTDCVLRVDNVEVDRAKGIWVDAAGTVSCAFGHNFDKPGKHSVAVSADIVTPWDDSYMNNSASTSIEVEDPKPPPPPPPPPDGSIPMQSSIALSVLETHTRSYVHDFWYTTADGAPDGHEEQRGGGYGHNGNIYALAYKRLSFPSLAVTFEQSSDGANLPGASFGSLSPARFRHEVDKSGAVLDEKCGVAWSNISGVFVEVCTGDLIADGSVVLKEWTMVRVQNDAADATYYSKFYGTIWGYTYGTFDGYYTVQRGPRLSVGNDYAATVTISDGSKVLKAFNTLQFKPFGWSYSNPYTCQLNYPWWGGTMAKFCASQASTMIGKQGSGFTPF